jgi:replication factor C subunit 1
MSEKNAIQTPWTLYSKLFGPQAFSPVSGLSLNEKLDAYFNDHSIMPLFVQDNYPRAKFSKSTGLNPREKALKDLELLSSAADAISDGDLVDAMIHGFVLLVHLDGITLTAVYEQWSASVVSHAYSWYVLVRASCVLLPRTRRRSTWIPVVRPPFSLSRSLLMSYLYRWFGKNSTQGKLQRLLGDVQIHMRLRISGDRKEIRQNYIPALFGQLVTPLIEHGAVRTAYLALYAWTDAWH